MRFWSWSGIFVLSAVGCMSAPDDTTGTSVGEVSEAPSRAAETCLLVKGLTERDPGRDACVRGAEAFLRADAVAPASTPAAGRCVATCLAKETAAARAVSPDAHVGVLAARRFCAGSCNPPPACTEIAAAAADSDAEEATSFAEAVSSFCEPGARWNTRACLRTCMEAGVQLSVRYGESAGATWEGLVELQERVRRGLVEPCRARCLGDRVDDGIADDLTR